jgi:2-polyprenyl-3-methyl-5-hydroxy-6-metoxy-1,4-benzoquinol methylase
LFNRLNKNTYHFKKIDCNKLLAYQDNYFDTVISSETIEHLENPKQFLREINRILKKGGVFILSTPNIETIFSRIYFLFTGGLAGHTEDDYFISGHKAILTDYLVKQFAKEAGFIFHDTTYNCAYFPIIKLKFKKILLNKLFGWISIYKFRKK